LGAWVAKTFPQLRCKNARRNKARREAAKEFGELTPGQQQHWYTLAGKPPAAAIVDDMSLAELAGVPEPKAKRLPRKAASQLGLALISEAKTAGARDSNVSLPRVTAKCLQQAGFSRRQGKRLLGKRLPAKAWKCPAAGPAKKRGRPAKPTAMDDEAVKAVVQSKAAPSCRYRANGATIHLLPNKSWRKLHMATPELHQELSYRTLLRRVRGCRLSVSKGKKRTDVCDICKAWDCQVLPKFTGMHKEIVEALLIHCPTYWGAFFEAIEASPFFSDIAPALRIEAALYWEKMLEHLKAQPGATAHARAGMEVRAREELEATEARAIKEVEEEMVPIATEWGHHFALRDDIQAELQSQYRGPSEGTLYFIYDHKELVTLPIGPAEVGAQWYANARLAVGICGFYVWGESMGERGEWYLYCSRVIERDSVYTMALLWDLFERIKLENRDSVEKLVSWADAGTHFRSYKVLASLGVLVPDTYRKHVTINWGPEKHMKGVVDGKFAGLDAAKDDAATRKDITSIAELVQAFEEDYQQRQLIDPALPKEHFINFLPGLKKDIRCRDFATAGGHGGVGIQACYSWEFVLLDQRRVRVFGRGAAADVATNLKAYCRGLPGRASANDVSFTPVLAPAGGPPVVHPDAPGDGGEAPEAAAAAAELPAAAAELPPAAAAGLAAAAGPAAGADAAAGAELAAGAEPAPGAAPAAAGRGAELEGDGVAEEAFVEAAEDVPENAKMVNGWRCSYRTQAPERRSLKKYRHRLQQRVRWIKKAKHELTATRRKSHEVLRAAALRSAALKQARAKRTGAVLKGLRRKARE